MTREDCISIWEISPTPGTTLKRPREPATTGEELILLLGQCYENLNDRTYALTVYQSYLGTSQSKAVYNQMGMCYAAVRRL